MFRLQVFQLSHTSNWRKNKFQILDTILLCFCLSVSVKYEETECRISFSHSLSFSTRESVRGKERRLDTKEESDGLPTTCLHCLRENLVLPNRLRQSITQHKIVEFSKLCRKTFGNHFSSTVPHFLQWIMDRSTPCMWWLYYVRLKSTMQLSVNKNSITSQILLLKGNLL